MDAVIDLKWSNEEIFAGIRYITSNHKGPLSEAISVISREISKLNIFQKHIYENALFRHCSFNFNALCIFHFVFSHYQYFSSQYFILILSKFKKYINKLISRSTFYFECGTNWNKSCFHQNELHVPPSE